MNNLYAGFARTNINPMMGIGISGYFIVRKAEAILDDLEINAVALKSGEDCAVMLSVDLLYVETFIAEECKAKIAKRLGISEEAVFLHATHTHTGPYLDPKCKLAKHFNEEEVALIAEYQRFFVRRAVDVAEAAYKDLKPAKMGYAVGKASNIAFIRRFWMKDGTVKTNPGVNNPDIVAPVGELDESVNVVRFDREGANSIALVNFGNHPDVVGGCKISADWPGFFRRTLEKVLDGVSAVMFNGAQGDVNHVNVHPTPGYLNDTFNDFDDVSRGYYHSRYMGRVLAGSVLQVWDKVNYVDVDSIKYAQKTANVPSNMPRPEDMPEAHRINDLHNEGRDAELPYQGMMLTTVVAEAGRMVRLEHGPEFFPMTFTALSIGNIAFFGIPGVPFNGIGRGVKESEGWDLVIPCCLTNGAEGYFPMKDAYEQGGYEARSSHFKEGVAEFIIEQGKEMLEDLRK